VLVAGQGGVVLVGSYMPIHLAPIFRRRFIARSAVLGASLACLPRLLAGSAKINPHLLALFSDIHVAADRALKVRNVNMTDHFVQARQQLLSLPETPGNFFINGDCAYNSGLPEDYALVAELLEPIRIAQMPVHLSIGNHDHRERFWSAFQEEKLAAHPVKERQTSLLQLEQANVFILDSLDKTLATPGLLGEEQLKWLGEALDAHRSKPAIVMVHHNPGVTGGNMGLKDTLNFLEVIRPRKQVKAYIFGHTHSWHVEPDSSGIHFINLPAVSYVFKEGDPSGWVLATLGKKGMQLELRCIDPATKGNGDKIDLKLRA